MSYPFLEAMGLTAPEGVDVAYEELLAEVLTSGARKSDRTGTGTLSVFGRQLRYDLSKGFPRITTKFVAMKAVKGELLWFLRGDTNVRWLQERGITIWDECAATPRSRSWYPTPPVSWGRFMGTSGVAGRVLTGPPMTRLRS